MSTLQEKATLSSLGVYLHVPFCARSCDFCNFYQEAPDRGLLDRYLDGIGSELKSLPPDRPVETVFWGGGTPGLLAPKDLERLGKMLLQLLPHQPKEWTIEMAPATVTPDRISVLKDLGVNRISVGVQSFQEELLNRLGRIHAPSRVYQAIEHLKSADFENFNLDLIFAIPGQSLKNWEKDLREAVRMEPAHLSTYCLTFEEDTALWVKLHRGEVVKQSIENESDYYQLGWEVLSELGYGQYEISNFSKPGFACVHNLNTWRMQEWLAYGPSASGQYKGERFTREPNLELWLDGIESGSSAFSEKISISELDLATDALVFGLRMNEGVQLNEWRRRFNISVDPRLEQFFAMLTHESLAVLENETLKLTIEGRLLVDRIGSDLLALMIKD